MMRRAFSVYRSNMSPLPPSSPVSCRVSDTPHTLGNPLGPYIIMQSRYQRTQVPKELRFMILRTRPPFLGNMATTTCKPAAEPVLPLVRTVPENVQSRDTFCLH